MKSSIQYKDSFDMYIQWEIFIFCSIEIGVLPGAYTFFGRVTEVEALKFIFGSLPLTFFERKIFFMVTDHQFKFFCPMHIFKIVELVFAEYVLKKCALENRYRKKIVTWMS